MMVLEKGLEPSHPCEYMNLNHARLPIPPLEHKKALQKASQLSPNPRIMDGMSTKRLEPESSNSIGLEPQDEQTGHFEATAGADLSPAGRVFFTKALRSPRLAVALIASGIPANCVGRKVFVPVANIWTPIPVPDAATAVALFRMEALDQHIGERNLLAKSIASIEARDILSEDGRTDQQ